MTTLTLPRLEPFQGLLQTRVPCPGGVQGQVGPGAIWAMDGMSCEVVSTPKQCWMLAVCDSPSAAGAGALAKGWCSVIGASPGYSSRQSRGCSSQTIRNEQLQCLPSP